MVFMPLLNPIFSTQAWEGDSEGLIEVVSPIAILGYGISLEDSNQVHGSLNVTTEMTFSVTVSCQLLLVDPLGTIIYDNFRGVGGVTDFRLTTVYNNSISTIDFAFSLPVSRSGTYSYMFSLFGTDRENLYSTTGWLPAFVHFPPTKMSYDLGSLSSESSISRSLDISINRFESIKCSFTLLEPVTSIIITPASSLNSKFIGKLNQSDILNSRELSYVTGFPISMWLLHNLPAGEYDLVLAGVSDVAFLIGITINSGEKIIAPSIAITEVSSTSEFATPDGLMTYHVKVSWRITARDKVIVVAQLADEIMDSAELALTPLHGSETDFYLCLRAPPTVGDYVVDFSATLEGSGSESTMSSPLRVIYSQYNITIAPIVKYYKTNPSWVFWEPKREEYNDPSRLSALNITDIKIDRVNTYDHLTNEPLNVTISFRAHNKLTGEVLFGEGVHYEVRIKFGSSNPVPLGIIIAGDNETIYAHNLPIKDGKLSFTIMYNIWWVGECVEIGWAILEPLVQGILTASQVGIVAGSFMKYVQEIAKLAILYGTKIFIEQYDCYFTIDDAYEFVKSLAITLSDDLINTINLVINVSRKPIFAMVCALDYAYSTAKIGLLTYIYGIFRIAATIITKMPFIEILEKSLEKTFKKFMIEEVVVGKIGQKIAAKKFLDYFNIVLTAWESICTIVRALTAPPEEGKELQDAEVGIGHSVKVDPLISIEFTGPTVNTEVTYLRDVYGIVANVSANEGLVLVSVDQELASTYLPMFSDSRYRHNLFSWFGLDTTSTNLEWSPDSNSFELQGLGKMYLGLHELYFSLNNTWIHGYQKMSVDAVQVGTTAWLNSSFTYPFGKKLNYTIKVYLPQGSQNIVVLSNGNYTSENYVITLSTPADWIAVQFSPDDTVPSIGTPICVPNENMIDPEQEVTIYVNVTDIESGVDEVILSCWTSRTLAWSNVTMIFNVTTGLYEGKIPGQTAQTHVKYEIIACDRAGNIAVKENAGEYYVEDTTPPTIIHTPLTSAQEGQETTITAEITDNVAVEQAVLFYRKTGEITYNSVPMTISGSVYTGTIPATAITPSGVEYYINATDGVNSATHPTTDPLTSPHKVSVTQRVRIPWEGLVAVSIVLTILVAAALIIKRRKS